MRSSCISSTARREVAPAPSSGRRALALLALACALVGPGCTPDPDPGDVDADIDMAPGCVDGDVQPCVVDGACVGEQICTGGVFGDCEAPPEVCDGADNDCDGTADEDWADLGDDCTAGAGACAAGGRVVCTADGMGTMCDAMPGDGGDEMCDGIDNDCDGTADEEVAVGADCDTGLPGPCAEGLSTCDGGATRCVPNVDPADEICNGADDDCDGRIDEADNGGPIANPCHAGPDGTEGVGACVAGVEVCQNGAFTACDGAVLPTDEICDSVDNDCDGEVDELADGACVCTPGERRACYGGPDGTAGVGSCREGEQVCAADGTAWGPCLGEQQPQAEICDGLDTDCDGAVDELPGLGEPCSVGAGACGADGTQVCDMATGLVVCDAVAGLPADETCNGIDDDCDGNIDDVNGIGIPCRVGEGACAATGAFVCGPAGGVICDVEPNDPGDEVCDGIDNDCDGTVDEDIPGVGAPCEAGVGACRSAADTVCDPHAGAVVCPAVPQAGGDEACNRIDDDCDGEVDEAPECGECLDDTDCGADEVCEARACVAIPQACLGADPLDEFNGGPDDPVGINIGTTTVLSELDPTCGGRDAPEQVWRLDFGDYDGVVCLDSAGSAFDTTLSVREGGCAVGSPEIACSPGPLDPDASGDAAQLEVDWSPGAELYLIVDGAGPNESGPYRVVARPGPCAACQTDAECAAGLICAEGGCVPERCGDGRLDADEACDDGGNDSGDGCDAACAIEDGFVCFEAPAPIEVPAVINAREHCKPRNALPIDLPPWPAYRGFYVAGIARFNSGGFGWGRFAVSIERPDGTESAGGGNLGRSQDPAVVAELYRRYATAIFEIDPGASAAVFFPDSQCSDNDRSPLSTVVRSVSACRPAVCVDDGDCFRGEECVGGACIPRGCGDGIVGPGEACDDGAREAGDGCDAACAVEDGFECYDPPADARAEGVVVESRANCGETAENGVDVDLPPWPAYRGFYVDGALAIDGARYMGRVTVSVNDGPPIDERSLGPVDDPADVAAVYGDYATPAFPVADGDHVRVWMFDGNCDDNAASALTADVRAVSACRPSVCVEDADCFGFEVCAEGTCVPRTCGDGLLDADEECDDGGRDPGDGCAVDCTVEGGWFCLEPDGVAEVPFEINGRRDCGPVPGNGVTVDLEPWDAWRAPWTGGSVRFAADGRRSYAVFVAVDGEVVAQPPQGGVTVIRDVADEHLLEGQTTTPTFAVGPGQHVEVQFGDGNCGDNAGLAQGVMRPVSACRPLVCVADDECLGAEVCVGGSCVLACVEDADCGPGERCDGGLCVFEPCADDADCPGREQCDAGQCALPDDLDGDGIANADDIDSDGDGIPDAYECPEGGDFIVNGGFELPDVDGEVEVPADQVPGWQTTSNGGAFFELRDDGVDGVAAHAGAQLGGARDRALYQDLALPEGREVDVFVALRGRGDFETVELRLGTPGAGAQIAETPVFVDLWIPYFGRHAIPAGQPTTRLVVEQVRAGEPAGFFVDEARVLLRCDADTDTDGDGVLDRHDLDSDGDGIPDAEEAGHGLPHTDGVVDGEVGENGLVDDLEVGVDSDHLLYAIADADGDGISDFLQAPPVECIEGQVDCAIPECAALPMCTPLDVCPVDDRFEGNDDRSEATGLAAGTYRHLSACGETDVYRFTTCNEGYEMTFSRQSGGGTYDEYSNGQQFGDGLDMGARRPAGNSRVLVTHEIEITGNANLRYGLELSIEPLPFEPIGGCPEPGEPELMCDDGHDDDFDGLFDCDDPDCAADPHCMVPQTVRACRATEPWRVDSELWGDNRRGVDEIPTNGCGDTPGPESVHAFSGGDVPGVVCVRIDQNPGAVPLALSVRGARCDDAGSEVVCAPPGPQAQVNVETEPGVRYYAVVDAPVAGGGGAHALRILPGFCGNPFGEVCDNGRDEDADGLVDCDDDDCADALDCLETPAYCEPGCRALEDCLGAPFDPICVLACTDDQGRNAEYACSALHLADGRCDEQGFQECVRGR